MPELPEVQAVVDYLNPKLSNKIIHSIQCPNGYSKVIEGQNLNYYNKFLKSKIICSIWRRGKYIIFDLSKGYLLFHLRMTGQFLFVLSSTKELKHVSLQFLFLDGTSIYFKDIRKFGRTYISSDLTWLEKRLGVEPLSKELTPHWFYFMLKSHNRMIKPMLLNQNFIAGLGNIYVDEALWISKIHPKAISSRIEKNRSNILCNAIKDILKNAIKAKGTTFINFSYGFNNKGRFKNKLNVFGRTNEACPKCKMPISKIFVSQRGTHYCKKCQIL